ncbi:MAG: S9 family peptidase, partial [Sphingorhabdus sp.]
MKNQKLSLLALGSSFLSLSFASPLFASETIVVTGADTQINTVNPTPIPIEVWAQRDAVSAVEVSPDGKHLLILKMEGGNMGENVLEIYSTSDFSKPAKRLKGDKMEFITARWVSDKHIFGSAWDVVRSKVTGPE